VPMKPVMRLDRGLYTRDSAGSRPGAWTLTTSQNSQVDFALFLGHFGGDMTMVMLGSIKVSDVIYCAPRTTTSI